MFRPARGDNDATKAVRFQGACDLAHCLPEEFRVLESLASDNDVHTFGRNLPPIVRIAYDNIDVRARREIDSDIFPRRQGEERTVTSIDVLAPEIDDDERLRAARFEIIAPEGGHLVEGALVHG